LELTKKGNLCQHTHVCRHLTFFLSCRHTLSCRHITCCRHSAAEAEAQVTELAKRMKELTGMPDLANLPLNILYFKSFSLLPLLPIFKSF
jgi:hypothetical protein